MWFPGLGETASNLVHLVLAAGIVLMAPTLSERRRAEASALSIIPHMVAGSSVGRCVAACCGCHVASSERVRWNLALLRANKVGAADRPVGHRDRSTDRELDRPGRQNRRPEQGSEPGQGRRCPAPVPRSVRRSAPCPAFLGQSLTGATPAPTIRIWPGSDTPGTKERQAPMRTLRQAAMFLDRQMARAPGARRPAACGGRRDRTRPS